MTVHAFSYSKLSSFDKCPRAYEFRYVLGENERFSTIERHMGSTVHEALRWIYAERGAGRVRSPLDATEKFDELWDSPALAAAIVVKSGRAAEDYRREGREMVERHVAGRFRDDRTETLELERRFRVELDDGLRFNGIIDRVARNPDGTLRIVDYKTGSRVSDPSADPQLAYYAMWVLDEHGVDEVELVYEDLRQGRPLSGHLRRADLDAHLVTLLGSIRSILATDVYPARPSVLCRWCGFNPLCDAVEPALRFDPSRLAVAADGEGCPQCGAALRERSGRFGSFLGCSGYPGCRYTRNT